MKPIDTRLPNSNTFLSHPTYHHLCPAFDRCANRTSPPRSCLMLRCFRLPCAGILHKQAGRCKEARRSQARAHLHQGFLNQKKLATFSDGENLSAEKESLRHVARTTVSNSQRETNIMARDCVSYTLSRF